MVDESALDWVSVNVVLMVPEVLVIPDPVIRETALPDFSTSSDYAPKRMRVSAFYELDSMFEGDIFCRSKQEMNMLGMTTKACS